MDFRYFPNRPIWALVWNPERDVLIRLKEAVVPDVIRRGWVVIARESDLLPFNPPRLIPEDEPLPVEHPRRKEEDGA